MEYRQLGKSGLRVSVLSLGTMTFGGCGDFSKVGSTDVDAARRQVLERGGLHRPSNRGLRFSSKARTPSAKSAVPRSMP